MKNIFLASLSHADKNIEVELEIYLFQEDGLHYALCPSLDLVAAGNSTEESKEEFAQIFSEHILWCLDRGTLEQDLIGHGWSVAGQVICPPSFDVLIGGNKAFRDLLADKDYQKVTMKLRA